jgi:cardiolipin synthase C
MLSAGVQGLTARIDMIDAAERSLDIQSYIFRDDISGSLIVNALLRAADRGVRIRVLVDDGETVPGDEKILALTAHAGFAVRIFNPLTYRGHNRIRRGAEFLFNKSRLDYRMHNKLMVADNAAAIIGGRNIGDQYFQVASNSQFGDDDVIVVGPIVPRLQGVFDQFWNDPAAVPSQAIDKLHTSKVALESYLAELSNGERKLDAHQDDLTATQRPLMDLLSAKTTLSWAPVKLVYDSPDKKDVDKGERPGRLIYKAVAEQARTASTELVMVTAYFIPSKDELEVLKGERERHVRVRILTNSLKAAPNAEAHSGYTHYRVPLLQQGVELYEVRALLGSTPGSGQGREISQNGNYALHAKLFVFDRQRLLVGSMNFDQRSKHLNTEIGLLIDSAELAQEIVSRFDELTRLENSYVLSLHGDKGRPHIRWITREANAEVHYDAEPARSAWQKIKVRALSLLPLDPEL